MDELVRLGIDAGALYLKVIGLGPEGGVVLSMYEAHRGDPLGALHRLLHGPAAAGRVKVAVTGVLAPAISGSIGARPAESTNALRREVLRAVPGVRNVIDIGGGSVSFLSIGADGTLRGFQTNTLCAAGTGSFLDEQAERLGLEVSTLAGGVLEEEPPAIAARCAVFAKSDLIHRQQEGYGKPECWSGLCRGMVQTVISTLLKGRPLVGKTALVGGVALNPEVVRWLAEEVDELVIPEAPHLMQAAGTARLAEFESDLCCAGAEHRDREGKKVRPLRMPLRLQRTRYPDLGTEEAYEDEHGTEVRIIQWPAGKPVEVVMGLDVGSTSTKALLIDSGEQVVADFYRRTAGDPILATKRIFQAILSAASARNSRVEVKGVGTTGSGRKLVGSVVGADRVINEITAHLTGAAKVDPEIETIFEIGGQDSKYIHALHGGLRDSNMNYVCAAGTGSFIEEQARKLGFDLHAVGDAIMGVTAPVTSDRCTVFMEQDVSALIRDGFTKAEAMAAVMYSVAQNYLSKVVGRRYVSREKIFFQGATARNKALVAAFENLLGVEVMVTPLCHVAGCYGVALITQREMAAGAEKTGFVGLDFVSRQVSLSQEECGLCNNRCSITSADVEGRAERPSWGYLCGRDPDDTRARANRGFRFFREREKLWARSGRVGLPETAPQIGVPRALVQHTYLPMWRRFLGELGFRTVLSERTSRETVEFSNGWVGADYCFPVKVAHGHARELLEERGLDRIFVPHMVSAPPSKNETTETHFCPYNIGIPSMLRSAMKLHGLGGKKVVSPVVNLRWPRKKAVDLIARDMAPALGVTHRAVRRAWREALDAQAEYEEGLKKASAAALEEIRQEGRPAVVVLGRPYNVYDEGVNLALPRKLADLGLTAIPVDLLPLDDVDLGPEFRNMFWDYGRKILEAARYVASQPGFFAIYFSNFSCGPDAFLQTYVEEIMGEKPMLMIELDEHGADAGYMTRLEAFADVLEKAGRTRVSRFEFRSPRTDRDSLEGKTLWLPPLHPLGPRFIAAALRHAGYEARVLPAETAASFQTAKELCRGGECIPCPATLGAFIEKVEEEGGGHSRHALFMPTASGPCRFGQYATFDRVLLDRMGWKEMPIKSFTSLDSYDGLDVNDRRRAWWGIVLGDLLYKMATRTRPYELDPGAADRAFATSAAEIDAALERGIKPTEETARAVRRFEAIPVAPTDRPLVGIVGEIYVRCNAFCNQDLVRVIEEAGGEAWLAPMSEWMFYTTHMETYLRQDQMTVREKLGVKIKNHFVEEDERFWSDLCDPILADRREPPITATLEEGRRYVPVEFAGEAILTLGRTVEFIRGGADLVVNAAPFGCMPGSITAGILQQVEAEMGVPVVSMFYDGETDLSARIRVFLANMIEARQGVSERTAAPGAPYREAV